jgi:hypothetical protein
VHGLPKSVSLLCERRRRKPLESTVAMTILFPALAIAFAAFCVWLTVRIVNRRERWAKWTAITPAVSPVLYVPGFGPACWWLSEPLEQSNTSLPKIRCVPSIYWPIGKIATHVPRSLGLWLNWYATVGVPKEIAVYVPGESGDGIVFWGSARRLKRMIRRHD